MVLIERNPFCGGNSTKATSGINGALTQTQIQKGIPDSVEIFQSDIYRSSTLGKEEKPYPLGRYIDLIIGFWPRKAPLLWSGSSTVSAWTSVWSPDWADTPNPGLTGGKKGSPE